MSSSFRRVVAGAGAAKVTPAAPKTNEAVANCAPTKSSGEGHKQSQPRLSAYSALPQGCKAWAGSQIITSVGHTEWNALLGGGHPLGTLLWIEEDRFTDLALTLARYWVAEGVAQGQQILFAITEGEPDFSNPVTDTASSQSASSIPGAGASITDLKDFVDRLPRNSHLDKFRKKQKDHDKEVERDVCDPTTQKPTEKDSNEMSALSNQMSESAIIEEGDEGQEDEDEYEEDPSLVDAKMSAESEAGLKIAWQYSKSIQDERAGMNSKASCSPALSEKNVFCHSFDLSGRLVDQYEEQESMSVDLLLEEECESETDARNDEVLSPSKPLHMVHCCGEKVVAGVHNTRVRGHAMFCSVLAKIKALLETKASGSTSSSPVVRLLLLNPPLEEYAVYLPLLMSTIRQEQLPVAVMLTTQPWLYHGHETYHSSYVRTKRACADASFAVQGFAGLREPPPMEFRSLAGLLLVERLNTMSLSTFTPRRPPANKYGLKRDRRKLHMNLLHLPPEDYSSGGSSVSGGGVRSGGGKDSNKSSSSAPLVKGSGCSSSRKDGTGPLDF